MADTFKEIGATGLNEYSGIIQEDFLSELRGKQGYKRYNEMRMNSPVVGAMLQAIEQSIRGVEWTFTSDQGTEDERLVILAEAREKMEGSFSDHIIEALTMLPFGYALFELVYQRYESHIIWRKLAPRGQDSVERWLIDDNGTVTGIEQRPAPRYNLVQIPTEKLIVYRTRSERGNPEGRSILRTAWVSYYYTKHIQQIEALGIERDLAGLPVITLPDGADTDLNDTNSDASKALKVVRNVRNDEQAGLVLPFGWVFELASTGGSRAFDTDAIIQRYENRILMSALAQFLMLGSGKVGSLALSKDQTDLFTMSVNATADIIGAAILHQAVPRLMALNGYDAEGLKLEHSPAGDVDVSQLSEFLSKMGDKLTWTVEDESWLRGVAHLPAVTPEQIEEEKARKVEEQRRLFEQKSSFLQLQRGQQGKPTGDGPTGDGARKRKPVDPSQDPESDDQPLQGMSALEARAVLFGARANGNDTERSLYESRLQRKLRGFLVEQQARVIKAVKKGLK